MGQSSGGRRFIGAIGIMLLGTGLLLFLSAIYSGVSHFGDFTNFEGRTRSMGRRAVIGMGLFAFGGLLAAIGGRRRGDVNAHYRNYEDNTGRDFDPRAARHLTRPNDPAYDGYERPPAPPPERIVKIRCRSCSSLNDEQWNYCNSCGAPL